MKRILKIKVKNQFFSFVIFLIVFYIYVFITFHFVNVDVEPECPAGMSPIARRIAYPVDVVGHY